jgi:hypothetical protein
MLNKDTRPELLFTHEYDYESSTLKLECYKTEITVYFDVFEEVECIMVNDDELYPLDDNLYGIFVLYEHNFYSVFDVVSRAEAIISDLNDEWVRDARHERDHIDFYSNPNNRG